MNLLPFVTVLSLSLAAPALAMAQTFNPCWAVPSAAVNSSGNTRPVLVQTAKTSPQANFFAGLHGYGPRLNTATAPSHTAEASSMPVSN